jgi:hypothetical protein
VLDGRSGLGYKPTGLKAAHIGRLRCALLASARRCVNDCVQPTSSHDRTTIPSLIPDVGTPHDPATLQGEQKHIVAVAKQKRSEQPPPPQLASCTIRDTSPRCARGFTRPTQESQSDDVAANQGHLFGPGPAFELALTGNRVGQVKRTFDVNESRYRMVFRVLTAQSQAVFSQTLPDIRG